MAPRQLRVSPAELAVLKLLWDDEPLTARAIRERLYPEGTPSDNATVQKLLQRLEAKRLIERDRSKFAHTFTARATRSDIVGEELAALAERLTDGSLVPLIMHAVDARKLTAAERRDLRALLDGRASKHKGEN
ncbi:MAG: BlaI/MecI/CopY family transcriptional regulator [Planctomycetales bacterium]|nr:BlaI/MecI/CopY family transcriptional regulator [Planctomycetales bacterium]